MNTKKNKIADNSNESVNANKIGHQSKDQLYNSNSSISRGPKYEPFDFTVNQDFIEENKKLNPNIGKHRQNCRRKFAPYTRSQRRKRRMEVYRLHFEKGIPAIRIAEMMNVDRNTINNDLRILYNKALNDYDPNVITLDDILQKQLVRLEIQRNRLSLYLCDAKDLTSKITVERLISDIDFRLIGVIERINLNLARFWEEVIKKINKTAESEKLKTRYTSAFELNRISIYSRKRLDKLKEEILDEKNHV
jgi:hypothetical protein